MPKTFFSFVGIVLLLTSCKPPLLVLPTSTASSTPIPSQTPSMTLTPTSIFTPTPNATHTPTPTETVSLPLTEVLSRDVFEELVISGKINCQGSDEGGAQAIIQFIDQATAIGILSKGQLTLGS